MRPLTHSVMCSQAALPTKPKPRSASLTTTPSTNVKPQSQSPRLPTPKATPEPPKTSSKPPKSTPEPLKATSEPPKATSKPMSQLPHLMLAKPKSVSPRVVTPKTKSQPPRSVIPSAKTPGAKSPPLSDKKELLNQQSAKSVTSSPSGRDRNVLSKTPTKKIPPHVIPAAAFGEHEDVSSGDNDEPVVADRSRDETNATNRANIITREATEVSETTFAASDDVTCISDDITYDRLMERSDENVYGDNVAGSSDSGGGGSGGTTLIWSDDFAVCEDGDTESKRMSLPVKEKEKKKTKTCVSKRKTATLESRANAKRAKIAKIARERAADEDADRDAQEFLEALTSSPPPPPPPPEANTDDLALPHLELDPSTATTMMSVTTLSQNAVRDDICHDVLQVQAHGQADEKTYSDTRSTRVLHNAGGVVHERNHTETEHETSDIGNGNGTGGDDEVGEFATYSGSDVRDVYGHVRREQALRADEENKRELLEYAEPRALAAASAADMFAHNTPTRPRETVREEAIRLMTTIHTTTLQRFSLLCGNDLKLAGFNRTLRRLAETLAHNV